METRVRANFVIDFDLGGTIIRARLVSPVSRVGAPAASRQVRSLGAHDTLAFADAIADIHSTRVKSWSY